MGQHTPPDQQQRLVALWRTSNLSKAAFARAHRIRNATFLSWVTRHPPPSVPVPDFVQFFAEPPNRPASDFMIRVGPHELGFNGPPPPDWFGALVRELSSC